MRLIILTLFLVTTYAHAGVQKTGLKAAMNSGLVTVKATSTGESYHGKKLKLEIHNTTRDALQVHVDPALIFRPADTTYQDLLLPAENMIAIAPGSSTNIEVQTFCAKSYAHAPASDLSYNFLKQGDSILIKTSQYIRQNNLYDELGQTAIWAITNHHSLESVYDSDRPEVSRRLLDFMSKITGWPIPAYYKQYQLNTTTNAPAEAPHVLKIISNMEWHLDGPQKVSLGIYNAAGKLVQPVLEEQEMKRGGYKIDVQFEAQGATPGKYYIRLMENGAMKKEQEIKVD